MRTPRITIVDYGVGNLLSLKRGLEHCGGQVILTSKPEVIMAAERLVLPGVGAFASAMRTLRERDLVQAIRKFGEKGAPLLGICLGMQLLLDESEEFGLTKGLGLVAGRVIPVPETTTSGERLKIPHIGWNGLVLTESGNNWKGTLLQDNRPGDAAYFVHSYMVELSEPKYLLADCLYGGLRISAVIAHNQIMGCQFHPEKSGNVGLKILKRFCAD